MSWSLVNNIQYSPSQTPLEVSESLCELVTGLTAFLPLCQAIKMYNDGDVTWYIADSTNNVHVFVVCSNMAC